MTLTLPGFGLQASNECNVKAYDNKTALLKFALKSIMDPPGGS